MEVREDYLMVDFLKHATLKCGGVMVVPWEYHQSPSRHVRSFQNATTSLGMSFEAPNFELGPSVQDNGLRYHLLTSLGNVSN